MLEAAVAVLVMNQPDTLELVVLVELEAVEMEKVLLLD
jgi:hypothetical protein